MIQQGRVTDYASGRGQTIMFSWQEHEFVLRHYFRGGAVARLVKDLYLRVPGKENRAWAEWFVLMKLYHQGLPVPQPVAARMVKYPGCYRADLLTRRIASARPLSQVLVENPLPPAHWQQIGQTVARFHAAGVWHADLNAGNILFSKEQVYLLDFDRAQVSTCANFRGNLQRLQRSFAKIARRHPVFHYQPSDFEQLMTGYLDFLNSETVSVR